MRCLSAFHGVGISLIWKIRKVFVFQPSSVFISFVSFIELINSKIIQRLFSIKIKYLDENVWPKIFLSKKKIQEDLVVTWKFIEDNLLSTWPETPKSQLSQNLQLPKGIFFGLSSENLCEEDFWQSWKKCIGRRALSVVSAKKSIKDRATPKLKSLRGEELVPSSHKLPFSL